MKKKKLVESLFAIALLIFSFLVFLQIQTKIDERFVDYCNEKYGEGNWTVITVYDPNISKLGVVYKCVPEVHEK